MSALLALAIIGQVQYGQAQLCIQQRALYAPVQYQQQAYIQQETKFVPLPLEDAQVYYQGIVGQAYRSEQRKTEAQQAAASIDAKIDRLTAIIEALQKRIDASEPALPSHPGSSPAPPVPSFAPAASEAVPPPPTIGQAATRTKGHPGLASLTKSCAGCHTSPASAGGGFTVFATDGSLAKLDAVSLDAIDAAITSGRMPRRAPNLTVREYAAIRDFLGEQSSGVALNANFKKIGRRR